MARKPKAAVKSAAYPVPQTVAEARDLIRAIGENQASLRAIEDQCTQEITAAKARAEDRAKIFKAILKSHSKAVQSYCEAARAALTKDGRRKSYRFATGTVAWRFTPPRVTIRGAEKVIEAIKRRVWAAHYLRVKYEIDKDAMLKDAKRAVQIDGVTITSKEEFVIKPIQTNLEEVLK